MSKHLPENNYINEMALFVSLSWTKTVIALISHGINISKSESTVKWSFLVPVRGSGRENYSSSH